MVGVLLVYEKCCSDRVNCYAFCQSVAVIAITVACFSQSVAQTEETVARLMSSVADKQVSTNGSPQPRR